MTRFHTNQTYGLALPCYHTSMHAKQITHLILFLLFFAVLAACDNSATNRGALARGPLVQMVEQDSFSVVWSGPQNTKYSAELNIGVGKTKPAKSVESIGTNRYLAKFGELKPDTEYKYEIKNGDNEAATGTTRTAPAKNSKEFSFRFIAFGDSGSGLPEQYELAKKMREFEPRFIIHTGDLIYPDGEAEDYPEKFYRPYEKLLATSPFYPCIGNHDYRTNEGGPLFHEFVLPQNGPKGQTPERHYWFDYGPIRFVTFDTDLPKGEIDDVVVPWLEKVLSEKGPQWKIAFFHHPVYSNANYGPTRKLWDNVVPCLERNGVQLVLNGHDHLYERTHPLKNAEIVEPGKGVVYITTGAGGAQLYKSRPTAMKQIAFAFEASHSFTVIEASERELSLKQIRADGEVVEEYTIPHSSEANENE